MVVFKVLFKGFFFLFSGRAFWPLISPSLGSLKPNVPIRGVWVDLDFQEGGSCVFHVQQ